MQKKERHQEITRLIWYIEQDCSALLRSQNGENRSRTTRPLSIAQQSQQELASYIGPEQAQAMAYAIYNHMIEMESIDSIVPTV